MKMNSLFILLAVFSCNTFAATDTCSAQLSDINQKISTARSHGNDNEVSRLSTAKDKVISFCNDDRQVSHASDKVEKHDLKVKKVELELQQAEYELESAKTNGNIEKISKKTYKVEEKKIKLKSARSELEQAQRDYEQLIQENSQK